MKRGQFVSYAASAILILLATIFAHAADVAAGKEKAELCVGCHGENGISQMENIPSLAGQQDQFVQWQLVYFRAGSRKNEQMQPIVEQLHKEDIRHLRAQFPLRAPGGTPRRRTIRFCHPGASRPRPDAAAPPAIPTISPAPRRWRVSP